MYIGLLNETWILSADFLKVVSHQIKWKSVRYERSCFLWTYRHDEANSRFSQFCERIIKMHNLWRQLEKTLRGEVSKIFPNICARVAEREKIVETWTRLVRYEVLTGATMKSVLWHATTFSLGDMHGHFKGPFCLLHQNIFICCVLEDSHLKFMCALC